MFGKKNVDGVIELKVFEILLKADFANIVAYAFMTKFMQNAILHRHSKSVNDVVNMTEADIAEMIPKHNYQKNRELILETFKNCRSKVFQRILTA